MKARGDDRDDDTTIHVPYSLLLVMVFSLRIPLACFGLAASPSARPVLDSLFALHLFLR